MLRLRNKDNNMPLFFQSEYAILAGLDSSKFHLGLEERTITGRKQLIVFTMTPTNRVNVVYGFTYEKEVTPARYRISAHVNLGSGATAEFITVDDLKTRLRELGFSQKTVDAATVQLCEPKTNH